jgi:NDP-sugar pyrophosphorylase family protein
VSLSDNVSLAMNHHYKFLVEGEIDVFKIKQYRELYISLIPCLNKNGEIVKILNLKDKKSSLPVEAVLMAGGKGERLRPLTENIPKPLLKIGNKAIIDYNIDSLIHFGIDQIHVTVNYLKEKIEEHFAEPRKGITINCTREPEYFGTMGSIKFIERFSQPTVLVMNSDLFTNIDYEDFYLHFKEHDADIAVAAIPYSINIPYGIFELDGRNIQGLKEKPTFNYYANAGIYLIKQELLELVPSNEFFNATDFIEKLIKGGYKVIRYPITGYWIDIGKHEDFRKAQELVKHMQNEY